MPVDTQPVDSTKGTLLTPSPSQTGGTSTVARLEVALTKDGVNPVGTPKQITLASGGSTQLIGAANDLWGASFTPADLNASTFGVLIRRPDQNADEATTTARTVEFVKVTAYYNPSTGSLIMPERVAGTQFNIFGKESTRGTAVSPSIRLKAASAQFNPANESKEFRFQGDLLPGDFAITSEASEASVDGFPTYDEIGYLLASIIGKPVTQLVTAGVYRHQFNLNSRAAADVLTYTMEYGDASAAERVTHAILSEFGMNMTRKDVTLSGKFLARRIQDQTAITAGANCQQTLTMGTATSFQLRFNGATTTTLTTSGLTASAIQTALQGLTTVGAGNMTVSGSAPYTITGAGALAGAQLPLIEVVNAVGGAAPTVAYATNGRGGYTELDIVPVLPGQMSVYYASTLATLASGKLTRLFGGQINVANRFAPFWVMDDARTSWAGATESAMSLAMKLTVMADGAAQGMVTDAKNQTRKYLRLEATGPVLNPDNPHKLTIDLACKVRLIDNFREEGEIFAREFEVASTFDPTWGQAAQIRLVNGVASY